MRNSRQKNEGRDCFSPQSALSMNSLNLHAWDCFVYEDRDTWPQRYRTTALRERERERETKPWLRLSLRVKRYHFDTEQLWSVQHFQILWLSYFELSWHDTIIFEKKLLIILSLVIWMILVIHFWLFVGHTCGNANYLLPKCLLATWLLRLSFILSSRFCS